MQIKDMLDLSRFIKKPLTKTVDDIDNVHYRTLFHRDCIEDNYTDPDFLCSMQINTNLIYYTLTEAIVAATRLSLNLSVCFLYFIVYYHLRHDNVDPMTIYRISFSGAVVGYIVLQSWRLCVSGWTMENILKITLFSDLWVAICCGTFSYLWTPCLRTLTNTMDLDSVHALCGIMFGMHLCSFNYGIMAYCVSRPVSTNSAVVGMVCLASRLQSDEHALSLLSFGVLCFICFPQFCRQMWTWTPGSAVLVTLVSAVAYTVSIWCVLFVDFVYFIVVVIWPSMYVIYIQHKRNILGPWDEAKPDLTVDMEEIERGFERRRRAPPVPSCPPEDPRIVEWEAQGIGLPL